MHPVKTSERSDDELAGVAGAAGEPAFARLYERWFDPLYDHAARMLRDREAARGVVQATFGKALESVRRGREIAPERPWMYAVVRTEAIERRRPRTSGEDEVFALVDESRMIHPEAVVADRGLLALVWSAAAARGPDDYSLLDLHLRQELTADELAQALDLDKSAVCRRLSHLRTALEENVMLTLMLRRESNDCAEWDALAAGRRRLTPGLRQALHNHVNDCERCSMSRRRMPSPVAIFSALAPVPAPPGLRDEMWRELVSPPPAEDPRPRAADAASAAAAWWRGAGRAARVAAVAAAVLVGFGGVAGAIGLVSSDPAGPADPAGIHSTSHEVNVPDTDRVIRMVWRRQRGATAYSVVFSRSRDALPPALGALPGAATSTTSAPLSAGRWWFVLRTRGDDGAWTATERRGPYLIVAPAEPRPEREPKRRRRARRPEPAPEPAPIVPAAPVPVVEEAPEPRPKPPARRERRGQAPRDERPAPEPKTRPKPEPEPPAPVPAPPPETPPQQPPPPPTEPPSPPPGEPPPGEPPPGEPPPRP